MVQFLDSLGKLRDDEASNDDIVIINREDTSTEVTSLFLFNI
jgi:hypothetical protein